MINRAINLDIEEVEPSLFDCDCIEDVYAEYGPIKSATPHIYLHHSVEHTNPAWMLDDLIEITSKLGQCKVLYMQDDDVFFLAPEKSLFEVFGKQRKNIPTSMDEGIDYGFKIQPDQVRSLSIPVDTSIEMKIHLFAPHSIKGNPCIRGYLSFEVGGEMTRTKGEHVEWNPNEPDSFNRPNIQKWFEEIFDRFQFNFKSNHSGGINLMRLKSLDVEFKDRAIDFIVESFQKFMKRSSSLHSFDEGIIEYIDKICNEP